MGTIPQPLLAKTQRLLLQELLPPQLLPLLMDIQLQLDMAMLSSNMVMPLLLLWFEAMGTLDTMESVRLIPHPQLTLVQKLILGMVTPHPPLFLPQCVIVFQSNSAKMFLSALLGKLPRPCVPLM